MERLAGTLAHDTRDDQPLLEWLEAGVAEAPGVARSCSSEGKSAHRCGLSVYDRSPLTLAPLITYLS